MILSSLNHLLKLLGGDDAVPEDRKAIFDETVLLVLARATDSDANIRPVEVDTVRAIVKKTTGEDVSAADVRIAAHSKIYESAPLDRHLAQMAGRMGIYDRASIAKALAEVITSDERITNKEVRFFNMVAGALQLTPAALSGVFATE